MILMTSLSPSEALMIVELPKSKPRVRKARQKIRPGRLSSRWYRRSFASRLDSMAAFS